MLLGVLASEVLLSARTKKMKCLNVVWLWRRLAGSRPRLEPLVSHHQAVVDQFLRNGGWRHQLPVDDDLLSSDRCAWQPKRVFPFTVIGVNALAVYMATEVYDFRRIGDIFVRSLLARVGPWDEVLSAAASLTILWLILYWMYRTRTFVKL